MVVFAGLLGIWFALSVLNQLEWGRARAWRRGDLFQLLPLWNFFAPNPGVHDYYLLYRDRSETEEPGSWRLLQPTKPRRLTSCLWNPDKIENKVLSDLVQMFTEDQKPAATDASTVMLSVPYLLCLKMAIEAPREGGATLRQFVLAQKQGLVGADPFLPILISDFHSFE